MQQKGCLIMRKIVYGKMMDGYRYFHIITRGGACYGRFYEGDWAYVHYRSHINGTDYMQDMPKKEVLDVVRGRQNWSSFEDACFYYWQKEQEDMERCREENLD